MSSIKILKHWKKVAKIPSNWKNKIREKFDISDFFYVFFKLFTLKLNVRALKNDSFSKEAILKKYEFSRQNAKLIFVSPK